MAEQFCGIDVSKDVLDSGVSDSDDVTGFANTEERIAELVEHLVLRRIRRPSVEDQTLGP